VTMLAARTIARYAMLAEKRGPGSRAAAGPQMKIGVFVNSVPRYNVLVLDGDQVITGRGAVQPAPGNRDRAEIVRRIGLALGGDGLVLLTDRIPKWQGLLCSQGKAWETVLDPDVGVIRIGNLALIERDQDPMLSANLVDVAVMHQWFYDLVGVPFYGDGGTTSSILLDATISVRGREVLRKWGERGARLIPHVIESPWLGPWGPKDGPGINLDRNAQYLAAAGGALLPMDGLEHDAPGGIGYHLITVPVNPESRLPHPCGAVAVPGEKRWVATPTLDLLQSLECDVHVTDSWTCPRERSRRLLSGPGEKGRGKWYERLRDARAALVGDPSREAPLVQAAVKATYTRGIGSALVRDTGRWFRPDWAAIIQAKARCDMWRCMRAAGTVSDIWPVATRTDSVTYAQLPPFKLGAGIGEWNVSL
jgi:hypothetical protein